MHDGALRDMHAEHRTRWGAFQEIVLGAFQEIVLGAIQEIIMGAFQEILLGAFQEILLEAFYRFSTQPGGHVSCLPPITWTCKWGTDWAPCSPSLMTIR